jgi:hypothetical protein
MTEPTGDGGYEGGEEPESRRPDAGDEGARRGRPPRQRPEEFAPDSTEGRGGRMEDLSPDDFE